MTGLERFLKVKQEEVAELTHLEAQGRFPSAWTRPRPSFRETLLSSKAGPLAVIAEFKKASPSRGVICASLEPEEVARQYAENGASCLSILTEEHFFKGDISYLARTAGVVPEMPLLRKDFIFHPLQVRATLATPASALLLIVRLTPDVAHLRRLREQAEEGGVEAVVEVFDADDLQRARAGGASIIQVNARDLATLRVDREACLRLIQENPPKPGELWIAASGMSCRQDLEEAAQAGYHAALIGSSLMEHGTPGRSLHRLLAGRESSVPRKGLLVKICGMTEQAVIDKAAALGADMCGFVFHEGSPRNISPSLAAELDTHGMLRVGVFVKQSVEETAAVIRSAKLDRIQLHGDQSAEFASAFPAGMVIRVLFPARYASKSELQKEIDRFARNCGMYLLDAGMGGGKPLDWNMLADLHFPHPWLLAGGLGADNVAEAVGLCSPDGVDLNSRLEHAPGRKSPERMEAVFTVLSKQRG